MIQFVVLLFSTLVLSQNTFAAPNESLGEKLDLSTSVEKTETPKTNETYEFDLTPMKKPKTTHVSTDKPAYLTSDYSLAINISTGYSSFYSWSYAIGFQYFNFKSSLNLESSFQVYDRGAAQFSLAKKWFQFNFDANQVHYKLGLGLYMDPSQGVATLVDINNLGIVAQVGLESLLNRPLSYRIDLDFYAGKRASIIMLQAGYSWAW